MSPGDDRRLFLLVYYLRLVDSVKGLGQPSVRDVCEAKGVTSQPSRSLQEIANHAIDQASLAGENVRN
jgi:hypothetical protein